MAILAVSRDLQDLRRRLGAITVAYSYDGARPVTAEDLGAAGAMAVLLKDALKPNLIQTLEGQPCLMHCGPFANIAHGNSSLVSDMIGLKLGDYFVTESGFGSDMGMEKFMDIVCRVGGLRPSAVVLVATVRALEAPRRSGRPRGPARRRTCARHLGIVREFGLPCVVAVNRLPDDTDDEVETGPPPRDGARRARGRAQRGLRQGRPGRGEARRGGCRRLRAAEPTSTTSTTLDDSIPDKIEAIATNELWRQGRLHLRRRPAQDRAVRTRRPRPTPDLHGQDPPLPVSRQRLLNAPTDFTLPVRDIRAYTGAGWLVPLCGDIQQMPGLGTDPRSTQRRHRRPRPDDRSFLSEAAQVVTARLLISCPDRPGIVAAVSSFLFRHGANIISSDQHSTDPEGGRFFMRMEFSTAGLGLDREELASAFRLDVADRFDMSWTLSHADQRKRMALMVSRYDHCLLDLLWRARRGELDAEVAMVASNHPDLERQVAAFGVPYHHVPVAPDGKGEAEDRLLELMAGKVDVVVLARYMQILSPGFLERVGAPLINIHHSFLPAFAGADPYGQAHERGVKIIGATAHYVTEDLDAGPIIAQDVQRVSHEESVPELARVGEDIERTVLARAVKLHLEDRTLVYENKTVVF